MSFSLFEFLQHATVKINCTLKDGSAASGTGFYYQFSFNDNTSSTVIVTNKHVIEDAIVGEIVITAFDAQGKPNFQDITKVKLNNFESQWLMHPENNIDLCILPIAGLMNEYAKTGKDACFAPFRKAEMPDFDNLEIYKPTENIYMVGYPNGLGDDI